MAIDSTNTLGEAGHTTIKKWAADLVEMDDFSINPNAPLAERSRVEVIQFWANGVLKRTARSQAVVDIQLEDYDSKEDLENKINSLHFNGSGNTIIPHALALLNREISNPPERETCVLVLTDGIDDSTPTNRELANINGSKPRTLGEEAKTLHDKNVQVLAIGFGDYYMPNLTAIALSEDNVIADSDLGNALNRTYNKLVTGHCPNSSAVTLRPTNGEFNRCVGE